MSAIRVLLVDDHTLVRAGLRALLSAMEGVEVIGEARDGQDAVMVCRTLQPNVVLMDISMKQVNGLAATSLLKAEFPDIHVVILTMHATEDYVLKALRAGAEAYLLKDAASTELETAIRSAARGESYLSPQVSRPVVDSYLNRVAPTSSRSDAPSIHNITPRQREILTLIAKGNSTKEIAFQLALSSKTVETHRMQIMERLRIRDIPGLVRFAIRVGLVSLEGL